MEKLNVAATGRWLSLVCASLGMLISMPRDASAQSALTWARVELTRNQVQLFTNGQSRRARVSDVLGVGDALSTARRARAELRFNDGSLARIGESAAFQFTPNTRNFRLSNGTVLLLIPPGQGRTTIQTPNAVTGIHGSALFVRFVPETGTTIIGALTNNADGPMMAFNQDGSQQQPLYAGEMAVLREDGSIERFVFELETFYKTSDLVVGLQLENLDVPIGDVAIDAVRQEIKDALEQQNRFEDEGEVMENPSFLSATLPSVTTPEQSGAAANAIPDFAVSPAAAFLQRDTIGSGFESVVSATVNQPATEVVPIAPPNGQPSVGQPPVGQPAPQPVTPAKPSSPIAGPTPAPTPAPVPRPAPVPTPSPVTPPAGGPSPGENPPPPIEKPPAPIVPETNIVEPPAPTTIQPEPTPAPIDPPVVVSPPEPTPELIEPPIKPAIPIEPVPIVETPMTETVIPSTEVPEEINLIEAVTEPENAVQIERLPSEIAPTTFSENPAEEAAGGSEPPLENAPENTLSEPPL